MMKKHLATYLFVALTCLALPSVAHEYAPGIQQWKVKGGTLTLVSSVVTNGMALYAHNYNFYFQRSGDKDWYHVPLLDKGKPGGALSLQIANVPDMANRKLFPVSTFPHKER